MCLPSSVSFVLHRCSPFVMENFALEQCCRPQKHLIWISKGLIRPCLDLLPTNRWSIYDAVCKYIHTTSAFININVEKQKDWRPATSFSPHRAAFVKRSCFSVKAGKQKKNCVRIGFGSSTARLLRIPDTQLGVSRLRLTWGYYIFWHDYHIFPKELLSFIAWWLHAAPIFLP